MNIRFDIRRKANLEAFLKSLPRGTIRAALDAMADYFIGDGRHGLSHAPPRKQHGPGNPYQWQTEKQRRAYFASNGFGGGIPYKRTGKGVAGWEKKETGRGYQMLLKNRHAYMDYVQGFLQQRGHFADGWRKYRDIIISNTRGAMKAAQRAVAAWIKENQKSN